MGEMKFDVSEIKGGAGGKYRPILQCGDTVMPEEFVSFFSEAINTPRPFAKFILGTLEVKITELLQTGRPVNLGWVSFTPRLKGALGTKDATGSSDRLEVVATPSRTFRHCLRETDVVNVNQVGKPLLYEVMEDGQKNLNALHLPGTRVVVNGNNISIDMTHSDEGIWLENQDGNVISNAQVLYSDFAVSYIKFPVLPPKKGIYVLVLSCRNGRGTDFKPKRLTRRVTVR